MIRLVSILFVGLALLLSPLSMAKAGMATHEAAAAASHGDGHCPESGAPAEEQDSDAGMTCSSACAAFPAVNPVSQDHPMPLAPLLAQAGHLLLAGIQPERETPPPRLAPKI